LEHPPRKTSITKTEKYLPNALIFTKAVICCPLVTGLRQKYFIFARISAASGKFRNE
jgi:hypothetical protein